MSQDDELSRLVRTLHETQQRILELTDGSVDAVMHPSGTSYLLHQAQEQLRRYANQRAAILNALPAHIALLDPDGWIVTVNEAWRRFAIANVFPSDDFGIGRNYIEICEDAHGDCSDEALDAARGIHAVLNGEQPVFTLEYPCHSPTEKRWFRLMVTPIDDRQDVGAVVTHIDITERKLAEEALRESEGRFRSLLQDVPNVAIQGYGLDGRVHYWNRASEILYGYTKREALDGNLLGLIIPPEMRDTVREALKGVAAGGDIENGELPLMRKDGSRVSVYSSHTVLRRPGQAPELFCIDIDLTERKALEEQLRQSQRLESVGQLTGGVAHDFNNLLTVIQGNAELLVEELANDARLHPLAEMVIKGARRGAELTHHLLAFARKQALEPRIVDINRLVTGMDTLLRRTLGEHIEIERVCNAGLWPVLIDPGQLENALLNLALNARDAMPGGGKLTIETRNTELDRDYAERHADVVSGQYVQVSVSDTGTGIPPEHLDRVFEPFYTTKAKGKGTGLGLSMVYGFVKQSDGHVTIHSEPGRCTTVTLYLPRTAETATATPAAVRPEHTSVSGDETLLLVEDDPMVRRYVEGQLASLGYRVLSAANGPEALEILGRHADIDLLFTDIVMPGGMNGRELADAARAVRPDLKVLFTSGYTENAVIHHGRLDPGVQLLSKPYRRSELAARIRTALSEVES